MARHAKGRAQRVLAIGDAHDSPHLPDKSRFQWMGRHANATRPDHIVQIGDWFTFDSCTQHDGNGTIRGRSKPTFRADMKSGAASMDAFTQYQSPRATSKVSSAPNQARPSLRNSMLVSVRRSWISHV